MEVARLLKRRPWALASALVILIVVLTGLLAPLVAPYRYNEMSLTERLVPPGGNHLLGTDNLGRDVFSRLLYGARPYVFIALFGTGAAVLLGGALGTFAARLRGKVDAVVRVAVQVPVVFLAVALLLIEVTNMPRLWSGIDYLPAFWVRLFPGVVFVPGFLPRTLSSSILSALGTVWNPGSFVILVAVILAAIFAPAVFGLARSAFAANGDAGRIKAGRAWPNFLSFVSTILVCLWVATGLAILIISPGDYLGFGIPPPSPTWGNMIIGASRQYLSEGPWMSTAPTVALLVAIVGALLFAVATRETWAPRQSAIQIRVPSASGAEKADFWPRWTAALIDVLVFGLLGYGISAGLALLVPPPVIFGLSWGVAGVYLALFWLWVGATPGKMLMGIRVVAARDGGDLTVRQVVLRMIGYLVSFASLGVGFIISAFDRERRGLPDRLAGTVVVKRSAGPSL